MQDVQQDKKRSNALRPINAEIVDGENNPVFYDFAYSVKGDALPGSIDQIKQVHGQNVRLLPLSGASGGGGIFQISSPANGPIVGLQITPTSQPNIELGEVSDLTTLALDQIIIDQERERIYAGAAITLDQLSQALADRLGEQYRILGADLTSYTYAQVGATFMTGGMGPQRRYFSDSVTSISLHNGDQIELISGDRLCDYAGTYGWTGLVTAVCCRYYTLPMHEIAFAVPVSNTPDHLARLLASFSAHAYLKFDNSRVVTVNNETDLITGLEHVTALSMEPMFQRDGDNPVTRRAAGLKQKCLDAGADGLLFVSGYSDRSTDEFLLRLIDDPESKELTIAGTSLEYTEVFSDPDLMRALREAIPFAARTQEPEGQFVYKGHTDATIRLHPDRVASAMSSLWQANQDYVNSVEAIFDDNSEVEGQILIYGHLNPYGVDPHNRLTMACNDEAVFKNAVSFLHEKRAHFYQALSALCDDTGSLFIGGEKGAGSEQEILPALGGPENAPTALADKFNRQSAVIRTASPMFNWRALAPYH